MTNIEQAIKEAVEKGGYEKPNFGRSPFEVTFLDPAFWQALCQARAWSGTVCLRDYRRMSDEQLTSRLELTAWQYFWHRFIDHLAEGKDAESFFGQLV